MRAKRRFASSFVATWCVLIAAFAASAGSAFAQKGETIALYTFSDSSNLFADSSGNDYNLGWAGVSTGVAQSTTEFSGAAPTSVSVFFPGAHGVAYGSMALSSHTALTFDWFMKTEATRAADGVVFQLGSNVVSTGFLTVRLLTNAVESAPTTLRVTQRLSNGTYDITEFAIGDPSSWANYTLTVDNSIIGAGHVSLLIDGSAQAPSVVGTGTVAGTFFDELRIGAASSSANPFTGYLQNFEVYSGTAIPEPATVAMLMGLAGAAMALVVRRHR